MDNLVEGLVFTMLSIPLVAAHLAARGAAQPEGGEKP